MSDPDIILVDDDEDIRLSLGQTLELAGYNILAFARAERAIERIGPNFNGIVISDIKMPGMDGLQLLEAVLRIDMTIPVLLITGHGDVPLAVEALGKGAFDFIEKPFVKDRLISAIKRGLEHRRMVLELRHLRETASDDGPLDSLIMGQSAPIVELRRKVETIAESDIDVLIVGANPSGDRMVLVDACRKVGTPLLTAASLIRAGRVPSAAIDPGRNGLGAIHVDLQDLRTAVIAGMLDAVPKLKTAAIIGGSLRMVDYLLTMGELMLAKRGPALRGHAMPAVTCASIDRFLADHTTLGRLSRATGLSFQRLRFELPKLKVLPRPVPKATGHIYRKAGLRNVIIASDLEFPGPLNWDKM